MFRFFALIPEPEEPPELPPTPSDELDEMVLYRLSRFEEMGFGYSVALELALASVDWHKADDMIDHGATLEQTASILQP